ncbi:hypothetical protein [Runella slithyformis]|uniref:Uncharacterized protein n=1 Tax=Runella slithyformis (strain ATCC 29530 / DSM 19594 / LMG 11500 / NCIMB 11436 / LSU 4) TaxID=761193 RepID=A0A7U4E8X8_RUNSL|nr:hypothetical protein [Runella slithyformis]AEI52113.1 hypothetical protein Runsl_5816 [Runella slithyformis DSM 19594]
MQKDKVYFARKFGVAEKDIVPEFLPVLIVSDQLAESTQALIEKVNGSITTHQHFYDKASPWAVFMNRWGWGAWAFLGLVIFSFLLMFFSTNRQKLAQLESVMIYNDSTKTYFIDRRFYKVVNTKSKKGIELIP